MFTSLFTRANGSLRGIAVDGVCAWEGTKPAYQPSHNEGLVT